MVAREDALTYKMIQRADTVGVFQIESHARMTMLPRLKPTCFYDLVIQVAIVRRGLIQGGMVHPYLRRRAGEEAIKYSSEEIRAATECTLGIPLFQEQVMQIAMAAATSPLVKRTNCGAPWAPGASAAGSSRISRSSCSACWPRATHRSSPTELRSKLKASAATVSPKATQRASHS
jgi:hypothetical protein